jgi:hypothetical protein
MLSRPRLRYTAGMSRLGYVLLTIAAASFAGNELFDSTRGDVRTVTARCELERLLNRFSIDWSEWRRPRCEVEHLNAAIWHGEADVAGNTPRGGLEASNEPMDARALASGVKPHRPERRPHELEACSANVRSATDSSSETSFDTKPVGDVISPRRRHSS